MAFLCGLTQFFLSHFERSAKILRKIAVNGEKCATDSIYKGFKCGTIAGSPECWWVTTSEVDIVDENQYKMTNTDDKNSNIASSDFSYFGKDSKLDEENKTIGTSISSLATKKLP